MFLTGGATYPGMPPPFAWPAAIGDLVAALLAFVSLFSVVLRDWTKARPLVWIFNVWGTLDLLVAITLATIYRAPVFMGAAYWIPAFWAPALLVTHYVTFVGLTKYWKSTEKNELKGYRMKRYQPPFFPGIEPRRRANLPEPRALNRLIAGIVFVLCPK